LVHFEEGRVELILSIRELAHGRDKIRNFRVHAHFKPEVEGRSVALVRMGTLQFSGRRVLTGARMVLHSVFGKVLPKGLRIPLMDERVVGDPRMDGLMITQCEVNHGWLGLALGLVRE
jgi:hypothetical protein